MQSIKFLKKDNHNFARIGTQDYKGYTVGDLPAKFAFIYYKGLTYVPKSDNPWA
jgi:hypothetical protein